VLRGSIKLIGHHSIGDQSIFIDLQRSARNQSLKPPRGEVRVYYQTSGPSKFRWHSLSRLVALCPDSSHKSISFEIDTLALVWHLVAFHNTPGSFCASTLRSSFRTATGLGLPLLTASITPTMKLKIRIVVSKNIRSIDAVVGVDTKLKPPHLFI